jgi:hypothetical protein
MLKNSARQLAANPVQYPPDELIKKARQRQCLEIWFEKSILFGASFEAGLR